MTAVVEAMIVLMEDTRTVMQARSIFITVIMTASGRCDDDSNTEWMY